MIRRQLRTPVRAALQAQKQVRAGLRRATGVTVRSGRALRVRSRELRELAAIAGAWVANECAAFNPFYRLSGERRACPACASAALKVLDVLAHHRLGGPREPTLVAGCRSCGLVFTNPLPSVEALAAFYEEGGKFAEEQVRRGLVGPAPPGGQEQAPPVRPRVGISDDERHKLRLLFEPVAAHLDVLSPPPGARVLDYGCGPGRLLNRLQALGWTTFGIEPAVKSAFPRHHELQQPPDEPTFQLVTLHHVLEHLPDPLHVLRTLSRAMVEGGILYISVPRLDALPLHRDLHYCLNPQAHIVSYTRDCLITLCHMAGLSAVTQPESASLDDLLTQGEPRRLRVLARKPAASDGREDATAGRPPADPLRQAEAALRGYDGRTWTLPPRLRAGRLQSKRRRDQLALRWQQLVSHWRRRA